MVLTTAGIHPSEAPGRSSSMRLDFSSVLLAIVLVFVVVASVQFLRDLPAGECGLLLFEKACPLRDAISTRGMH
jgi:hypothetical protein